MAERDNTLLASLPEPIRVNLLRDAETVRLASGTVLYEVDQAIDRVYFPTTAAISMIVATSSGDSVEVMMTGREGAVGLIGALGSGQSPWHSTVIFAGEAVAVRADRLRRVRDWAFLAMVLRYSEALQRMSAQTIACNRFHAVSQRMARWLLMAHDRASGDDLPVTHEFLSQQLGARRASVTEVVQMLERRGALTARRGRLTVVDRAELEAASCECYANSVQFLSRVRPDISPVLSSRPEVTEYYRSICDAIGRYVGDGGSVRLDTNTDDTGNTHIAFIVDTEKLAPYLEGRR